MSYDIRVHSAQEVNYTIDEEAVQKIVGGVFEWVGANLGRYVHSGIVEVSFISEDEIRDVNAEYRAKPQVTDVLSFYYLPDYRSSLVTAPSNVESLDPALEQAVAELLICPIQAARQAPEFDNDFGREIGRLLIHGSLHIAGFEHENVPKAVMQEMVDAENNLFDNYSYLFKNFSWLGES